MERVGMPSETMEQITVGPAGSGAEVCGATGRAIQLAIDALATRGGGVVRLLPGTYELIDSIRLVANTALIGEQDRTILRRRGPLVYSDLATDADVGQEQITPTDVSAFLPGMGVSLWDERSGWMFGSTPFRVRRIDEAGTLHIDRYLTSDVIAEARGRVLNHYPMILGYESPNLHIEGLTLDGTVEDPDGALGTMRSAAIYLHRCPDSSLRQLTVRHNPGDGICFGKASERVLVEDCETSHNGWYGLHPGSHSAYAIVRRCHIHHNHSDGLYICWGIRHGEFTDNHIHHNGLGMLRSGISIGHKDTDNLIARNHVHDNKKYGICFRQKTEANGPHRCTLRENTIENNGSSAEEFAELKATLPAHESIGCGVRVCGINHGLALERNTIRETRAGDHALQRIGVWLSEGVTGTRMTDNLIEGHPDDPVRDDSGAADHQLQSA